MKTLSLFIVLFLFANMQIFSQVTPPGNALHFDGTDDYVSITDDNSLDLTSNYTLEAWVMFDSFSELDGIISKYNSAGANGYILRLTNVAPYTGLTFDELQTNTGILEPNQWYHIAAVNDNGTRRLYLDGIEQALSGTPLTVQTNSDPLTIGVDYLEDGRFLNGKIDEVRIWNVARTKEEIIADMNDTINPATAGLVAYYRFDETGGSTVLPDLANSHNGTLTNMDANNDWQESYALVTPVKQPATNIGQVSFTLNWSPPVYSSATKYFISIDDDIDFSSPDVDNLDVGSALSYDFSTNKTNTKFYWRIKAYKDDVVGTGHYSYYDSVSLSPTLVYFVDGVAGDDNNSGTSWATAKKTIAGALDPSVENCEIIVKYGTYNISSEIVISSDRKLISDDGTHTNFASAIPDSSQCIIDANQNCRIFKITGTNVSNSTVIKGFKICNGDAYEEYKTDIYGGGILIEEGAQPVVTNCYFYNNVARGGSLTYCHGGAIANINLSSYTNATTKIYNNRFENNAASVEYKGYGGAIYSYNLITDIQNNTFVNNLANSNPNDYDGHGGAIYAKNGSIYIRNNVFDSNRAGYGSSKGGAVQISEMNFEIKNNIISNNVATVIQQGQGGGIYVTKNSHGTIKGNKILDNIASKNDYGYGGGIYIEDESPDIDIIGNLIKGNIANLSGTNGQGGGIFAEPEVDVFNNIFTKNIACASSNTDAAGTGGGYYGDFSRMYNNTFYANATTTQVTSDGVGSGLYASRSINELKNNIFAGHNIENSDKTAVNSYSNSESYYNDFYDNETNFDPYHGRCNTCFYENPLFEDPENDNFSIADTSVCLNTGDENTDTTDFPTDFIGHPRIFHNRIDIGAYEIVVPLITKQPTDTTVCENSNTYFLILTSGADNFQWQVNTGAGFSDLSNSGIYSGVNTDTLVINPVSSNMNNYQYRCIAINQYDTKTSDTALLKVNPTYYLSENADVCYGKSYTFPDGYTENNIISQIQHTSNLTSSCGCDSIIETTVDVIVIDTTYEDAQICYGESYTFPDSTTIDNITEQTTHFSTLQSVAGCDSVIKTTVNVTVIDTSVTQNNEILTSNENDASSYQWLDCDDGYSAISGATEQSFTATETGNYAVEITKDNCVDTSACYYVVIENLPETVNINISVSPNPTTGQFTVISELQPQNIIVTDVSGKKIFETNKINIDISDQQNGIYFIKITTSAGVFYQKIILYR